MAQDRPDILELLRTVEVFLQERAMPALDGELAFHARVSANLLRIAGRELRDGPAMDAAEAERLRDLLGSDAPLGEQTRRLAAAIRDGSLDGRMADVRAHVRQSVEDKLRVTNPGYLED
jgi:hypothetical protein